MIRGNEKISIYDYDTQTVYDFFMRGNYSSEEGEQFAKMLYENVSSAFFTSCLNKLNELKVSK